MWLSAPGGAGKTSLAAGWIEARRLPSLWYELDAADADPASLFFNLRLAAERLGAGAGLPAFAGEYARELTVFARRFFERLFAQVSGPLVVVFDNVHHVPAESPTHEALAALIGAVSPEVTVVFLSRAGAPPAYARWLADDALATLDWPQLRLTPDESAEIARAWGVKDTAQVAALHELARGWVAGVVLFLRALQQGMALPRPGAQPPQMVIDYFSNEVFATAEPALREFLLATAVLPHMTPALADALTGRRDAHAVLEELNRNNLYTERKAGADAVFEYHPRFREFLLTRAEAGQHPERLRALRERAALLLEADGQIEAATQLLIEAHAWPSLAQLALSHAAHLTGVGRFDLVRRMIEALPAGLREARPWLLYWLAWTRLAARDPAFRAAFEQALRRFESGGDVVGAFAALAWLARMSATRNEADRWIAELERLAAAHPTFASPREEARVIASFRLVQQFPPHHALLANWAVRAEALARELADPGERMGVAAFVLHQRIYAADIVGATALLAELRPLLDPATTSADDLVMYLHAEAYTQFMSGDRVAAEASLGRMQAVAEATGFLPHLIATWCIGSRVALAAGDVERAWRYQRLLEPVVASAPQHYWHYLTGNVYLHLAGGDPIAAANAARTVLSGADLFPAWTPLWLANLGQALAEAGDHVLALEHLQEAVGSARANRLPAIECAALLLQAHAAERAGHAELARDALAEGWGLARILGCVPALPWILPRTLAQLAGRALERGTEVEFVRAIIRRLQLRPPSAGDERWPWPMRVYALGRFSLVLEGRPLDSQGKTQKKPLELLKCVVALGGRDVSMNAVAEALWPEADGDDARKSFDITLHRLRKLLGEDEAITLSAGRLALDPARVWVDSIAFERLVGQAETQLNGRGEEDVRRALALYHGRAFAADDDAPWLAPYRVRLHAKYLRMVEHAGDAIERAGDWSAAHDLYQRTLEIDPVAEAVYRRLMRCLRARGRQAEAVAVYRRCRDMLGAVLGVAPSPETDALAEALRR